MAKPNTDREMIAVFKGADRENNSYYGNPNWTVHTSEGSFRTANDASVGYEINNFLATRAECGRVGRKMRFTLDRKSRITFIKDV